MVKVSPLLAGFIDNSLKATSNCSGENPSSFKELRMDFLRCAKAPFTTLKNAESFKGINLGWGSGVILTTDESTFGGGSKDVFLI